jgi:dGTPase
VDRLKWDHLLCEKRAKDVLPNSGVPLPDSDEQSGEGEGDPRSEFQRDYDRTLFSTPVRRLQDKAQVFPLEPNDSVRTRLTHSLEVSNLAKSIAARVGEKLEKEGEINEEQEQHLRIIAGTCGLMHDLGNPPFGHAGEEAMRDWFKQKLEEKRNGQKLRKTVDGKGRLLSKDFEKFDGNAQTIRLVTKLQMLADFRGLNLTLGTLSGALKYTARADDTNEEIHHREKPGYFASEQRMVRAIREHTESGKTRNPIAFIAEASDDIVYSAVDIEDGIKKQALSWEELKALGDGGEWEEIVEGAEKNINNRLEEAGLDENDLTPQALAEARAKIFRTKVIGKHVNAAVEAFDEHYESIMRGELHEELLKVGATSDILAKCKSLAREHIFPSTGILSLESMGRSVITDLMDIFWEGARDAPYDLDENPSVKKEFSWKAYHLMSNDYRMVFEREVKKTGRNQESGTEAPKEYHQLQLVADYICGMTDNFACSLHQELTNR